MLRTAITLLAIHLIVLDYAHAQKEILVKPNNQDIFFNPIAELDQNSAGPSLIGGRPADPTDWPASFYSSSEGRCTSTLVGPRVLLTAAHCVGNGKKATIRLSNGTQLSGPCSHAPNYPGDISADYALCLMNNPVEGVPFEYINLDENLVRKEDTVLLTGYGCIQQSGTGGNDGIYRIGEAKITRIPSTTEPYPNYYTAKGTAALCFGDSGGPAFQMKDMAETRVVISVNSRGNIQDTSWLSSTSSKDGKQFIEQWSRQNSAAICGLSQMVNGCR